MFRIALIGCGKIARRHVAACIRTPGVELVAMVDPVVSRAAELASAARLDACVVKSTQELDVDVDAAIIATPNHIHCSNAVDCLSHGINVLIEKPLATSVKDGESICSAAESNGRVAAVAYATRFKPDVQLMKRLIDDRYFGTIHRFVYQFGTRGGWAPLSNYNLDRDAIGGGVLVVTGTHFVDRMLYWFGDPAEASLLHDGVKGPEANAFASFVFDFQGERLLGEARFSKATQMPAGFCMDTDAGRVMLSDSDIGGIRHFPCSHHGLVVRLDAHCSEYSSQADIFQAQLADFVRSCQTNQPPMVSAEQGLTSLGLLERLYSSANLLDANLNALITAPKVVYS